MKKQRNIFYIFSKINNKIKNINLLFVIVLIQILLLNPIFSKDPLLDFVLNHKYRATDFNFGEISFRKKLKVVCLRTYLGNIDLCEKYEVDNKSIFVKSGPHMGGIIEIIDKNTIKWQGFTFKRFGNFEGIKKPLNCDSDNVYWYDGTCINCKTGYYLDTSNHCQAIPVNCQNVSEGGICILCKNGFYLDDADRSCKAKSYNCAVEDSKGICNDCKTGYYLNTSKQCQAIIQPQCKSASTSGICNSCKDGFYLDRANTCQVIPANCINMSSNDGVCNECKNGYSLNDSNQCVK